MRKEWAWAHSLFAGLVLLNASMGGCTVDENKYKFGSPTHTASGGSAQGGESSGASGGRLTGNDGGDAGGGSGSGGDGSGGDGPSVVVPPGQAATGMACLMDGDCTSSFCRDGVCCQDQCAGACQACSSTYTGLENGLCGPVKTGIDPHDDCADDSRSNPCGQDGQCDGGGQCRKYSLGRSCADATCTDASTFVPAGTCDGSGTCTAGVATDCGPYPCAVTGCAKPCTGDPDCPNGSYCSNGTCRTKKLSGEACSGAGECGTGFCSPDQVCCDNACTGACMACSNKLTGQPAGTCAAVQLGLDPKDDCATDPVDTCLHDGTCDGKGACHSYESGRSCGSGTCAGSTFTPGKVCNGSGLCVAGGTANDCGQSACAVDGCKTACTSTADCASGSTCVIATRVCAPKKANGTTCTLGSECVSNACVDGVCCESACTAKCYACSNDKTGATAGQCLPVKVGTDLDNDCSLANTNTCGQDGTCDGNGQCRLWSDGTQCAAGMCVSGNYVSPQTCSQGTCRAPTTDVCAPAVCDGAMGCKRTCTTNPDCIGATYCNTTTKTCAAQKTPGLTCASGFECLSGYCADGVCCNNPCNGTCVSCLAKDNGLQADGTCGNVKDGTDPATECAAGATTCGLDGMCGGGKCRSAPTTLSCGTVACSGSTLTPLSKCDGNGACPAAATMPCPGNVTCASTSACRSPTCTADANCVSGYYCAGGTCTQKKATGSACTGSDNQCTSNTCSQDGICCGSACAQACMGCNTTNTGVPSGTCAPLLMGGARNVAPCGGACSAGYALCVGATAADAVCNPTTWGFETGAPSDWQDALAPVNFTTRVPANTQGLPRTGSWALSSFGNQSSVAWQSQLRTVLCGDDATRTMDLRGKTFSMYIYAPTPEPNAASPRTCHIEYTGTDPAGDGFDGEIFPITFSQFDAWTLYSGTLTNTITKFRSLHVTCDFGAWPAATLYFDDISIK